MEKVKEKPLNSAESHTSVRWYVNTVVGVMEIVKRPAGTLEY